MTTNTLSQAMSSPQPSLKEGGPTQLLDDLKGLMDDVRTELGSIESSVSAVHVGTGRAISIPDELVRVGNALSSIRVLLILNLAALIVLCLK